MTRALILPAIWCALGIGLAVWSIPAWSQTCHDFDALDTSLRGEFDERAIVMAINPAGAAFLFYGNPDTETWTLVLLNGPCAIVIGSGEGYEEIPAFPGEAS